MTDATAPDDAPRRSSTAYLSAGPRDEIGAIVAGDARDIEYPEQLRVRWPAAGLRIGIGVGGRGVDTAWCYDNQPQVGVAVHNTSVPRDEIFVTSKVSHAPSVLPEPLLPASIRLL